MMCRDGRSSTRASVGKVGETLAGEIPFASPVFTTKEVARAAGVSPSEASRELAILEAEGNVMKVRQALWAIPHHPDFSIYAVVPRLVSAGERGYVSLLSALNLHGMIEQIPRRVHVMTTRHRPDLVTPLVRYEIHQIQPRLCGGFGPYRGKGNFDIATPAKAMFDTLYLSTRKRRRFSALPEVEIPRTFSEAEMDEWIGRITAHSVQTAVRRRWAAVSAAAFWEKPRE